MRCCLPQNVGSLSQAAAAGGATGTATTTTSTSTSQSSDTTIAATADDRNRLAVPTHAPAHFDAATDSPNTAIPSPLIASSAGGDQAANQRDVTMPTLSPQPAASEKALVAAGIKVEAGGVAARAAGWLSLPPGVTVKKEPDADRYVPLTIFIARSDHMLCCLLNFQILQTMFHFDFCIVLNRMQCESVGSSGETDVMYKSECINTWLESQQAKLTVPATTGADHTEAATRFKRPSLAMQMYETDEGERWKIERLYEFDALHQWFDYPLKRQKIVPDSDEGELSPQTHDGPLTAARGGGGSGGGDPYEFSDEASRGDRVTYGGGAGGAAGNRRMSGGNSNRKEEADTSLPVSAPTDIMCTYMSLWWIGLSGGGYGQEM